MEQPYFIIIPDLVRADKKISASAKLLFGEIMAKVGNTGYCWAKNEFFSKAMSCDDRTIRRYLKELEDNKYLRIDLSRTSAGTDRKIFIINGAGETVHRGRAKRSTGGGRNGPQGAGETVHIPGQNSPQGAGEIVHHNKEVSNKKKVKDKKTTDPLLITTGGDKKLFNLAKEIFLNFYLTKNESGEYYFKKVDAAKLKSIVTQLFFKCKEKQKKEVFTIEEMQGAANYFFINAYETGNDWLRANFSLTNIDSQFNTIYTAIVNYSNGKRTKTGNGANKAATANGVVNAINRRFNKTGDNS